MAAILSVNTRIAPLQLWANVGKSRINWQPTPYTWICSAHFVGGVKSDEPTSPAYTPSLFAHIKGLCKRQGESLLARNNRTKKRRLRVSELLKKSPSPQSSIPSLAEPQSSYSEPLPSLPEPEPLLPEASVPQQSVSSEQACSLWNILRI